MVFWSKGGQQRDQGLLREALPEGSQMVSSRHKTVHWWLWLTLQQHRTTQNSTKMLPWKVHDLYQSYTRIILKVHIYRWARCGYPCEQLRTFIWGIIHTNFQHVKHAFSNLRQYKWPNSYYIAFCFKRNILLIIWFWNLNPFKSSMK